MNQAEKVLAIHMINKHLVAGAVSVAMDGVAPESGQDDPLRE